MSRFIRRPINIPDSVTVTKQSQNLLFSGKLGKTQLTLNPVVVATIQDKEITLSPSSTEHALHPMLGTTYALIKNCITGVSDGFSKKLELIGVGYRAQIQQNKLNLTLGFSHPIEIIQPDGIVFETPSQNELLIKGIDKHLVGQISAKIRNLRPPEPYKGKGVKFENEIIARKEVKKK